MVVIEYYPAMIARDHCKWRVIFTFGVGEKLITGGTSEKEKFMA